MMRGGDIILPVTDLVKSLEFYENLGFVAQSQNHSNIERMTIVRLTDTTTYQGGGLAIILLYYWDQNISPSVLKIATCKKSLFVLYRDDIAYIRQCLSDLAGRHRIIGDNNSDNYIKIKSPDGLLFLVIKPRDEFDDVTLCRLVSSML